jgi:hypothetical protein
MNLESADRGLTAPRVVLLLPLAFALHLAEEIWGGMGLPAWSASVLGAGISPARFLAINAVAWPLFALAMLLATRHARCAWFAVALASLLGLNGALHALATLAFATYSPGTLSGVLLYLPLSAWILRRMHRRLPRSTFVGAIVAGIALHAGVALLAFG